MNSKEKNLITTLFWQHHEIQSEHQPTAPKRNKLNVDNVNLKSQRLLKINVVVDGRCSIWKKE